MQARLTTGASVAARLRGPVARVADARRHRLRGDHRGSGSARRRRPRAARPRLCGGLRLQGERPAEEGRPALGRRAQPGAVGQGAAAAAATSCSSTSRPTIWTWTRCGRSRTRCWPSPVVPWSSATTGGSSTASPPTCSPSRGSPRSGGGRGTSATTRRIATSGSASTPTSRTACVTSRSSGTEPEARRTGSVPEAARRPRRGWCRAGRRPPTGGRAELPDGTRTMHDDRVPNVSRWTQLAAFGRTSPSGFRWSVRMRRKACSTWSPSDVGVLSSACAHQIDLRRGLAEGPVFEHVDPRGQLERQPVARAGEVDEEQRACGRRRAATSRCSRPGETPPAARRPLRPRWRGGRARGAVRPGIASTDPWPRPAAGWSARHTRRAR